MIINEASGLKRFSLVAFSVILVACTSRTLPILPPPLKTEKKIDDSTPVEKEARRTEIIPLPAAPESNSVQSVRGSLEADAAAAISEAELVRVDVDQVSLTEFIQLVFSDVLKKSVSIDVKVRDRKDLVTFRSGAKQNAGQLDRAARLLLKSYQINVTDVGGLVRVQSDSDAFVGLPEIKRGAALPETPLPLRPVFHLIELKAVSGISISGILRGIFGEKLRLTEDVSRNGFLLGGPPDIVSAAIEAIRVLDSPALAGVESFAIRPAHLPADELAKRLSEVLTAQGYSVAPLNQPLPTGGRFPIILLPAASQNAVFVFARGSELVEHVSKWATTLDRAPDKAYGKGFFTYSVKHKDASILAQTLEQLLTGVRSPVASGNAQGSNSPSTGRAAGVVVDKPTNTLIFQVGQDEYPQIAALLQSLDRPSKSALIEVTVAELKISDGDQLGIDWLASRGISGAVLDGGSIIGGTLGGLGVGNAGATFKLLNSANQIRATLNALASQNRAKLLSSPRLLARNGEQASIQVGDEVPIVTSQLNGGLNSNPAPGTGAAQVLQTIQYRPVGVILKIKPAIHSSDQIDLDVVQEVSSARNTLTGVSSSPTISQRKIETKLTLRHGSTIMLGGLIGDEGSEGDAGVPFLKDIPLVGSAFRSKSRQGVRTEMVVLITPYVINDAVEAESITNSFRGILGNWARDVELPAKSQ